MRIRSVLGLLFLICIVASCSFGKKVKDGKTAYELKQYAVAVEMLLGEFEGADNRRQSAELAYYLGMSYHFLEETELSTKWLATAVERDYGSDASINLARAYKKQGEYSAAIKTYEGLREKSSNTRLIDREIYVLKEVAKWSEQEGSDVSVELMNESSGYSEYAPALLDDNFLVFTSDQSGASGSDTYTWTGNKHTDLFVMLKSGSDIRRFDAGINTDANEGTAAFTTDGLELIFTRCQATEDEDGYCKLMYSERFSGIWTEPTALPMMQEGVNYGQPTFIEGDSVLVFSAEITDGAGGHDLYYSERYINSDGSVGWGDAYIFPQTINSIGNEMFPVGDGDTLYFSSDYFAGLGGLDIFKTWLMPNGQWAPPQNLRAPINSSFDDFGYVVDNTVQLRDKEVQKGYFSSSRSGYGKEDLYRFTKRSNVVPVPQDTAINEKPIEIEIYLAGKTKEINFEDKANPNSLKLGKDDLADCYITISDGNVEENIYSDDKGRFYVELQKEKNYRIKASKLGYLNDFVSVSTSNLKADKGALSTTINVELVLNKIYSNVEITLENIYYNFNKSDIRDDAKPTLDSLAQILVNNPQIDIQLSSHTDCRGDDEYNSILSQKRAESAVNYIGSRGVPSYRMIAKGFGELQPAIACDCDDCSETDHQTNRRTTFKILE